MTCFTRSAFACSALLASLLTVLAAAASAQTYPTKPIRLIVPFAPGGPSDVLARTLAQKLTEAIKQTVIVDNRATASGTAGTDFVAKALPDGYTMLLIGVGALTINAAMFPKLPYDTLRDLAPVSVLSSAPYMLVVHPSLPVKSLQQLIALAKARPGQLNYAAGGPGYLLGTELLKEQTGVDIVHIPYKGAGPAMNDLIAGHVQVMMINMITGLTLSKAGRIRALGVTGMQRSVFAPELPTLDETGAPGLDVKGQHLILVASGTSRDIIARLHQEIVKVLQAPELKERLANEGAVVVGSTPEQAAALVRSELERWTRLVRRLKLTAD
jgi:tripartite-type tricarboxylate transporter receptor subunit TctC